MLRPMRLFFVIAGLAVAAVGTVTAGAAAASAPPRAALESFVCQTALDPPARAVSVQAVMRPVSGTQSMQLRFDFLRQLKPSGPFRAVRGRNLGTWISPEDPTLGQSPGDIWILNHPVVDLVAPATYRFRVTFRWIGSRGRVLGTTIQSSPTCYEPELRADLLVRSLSVTPAATGQDNYVAVIANRGQTAAGAFAVDLADGGIASGAITVPSLGPRGTRRVRFVAPACTAGSPLVVTVDPGRTVDEYDFANNVFTMPCSASS
jgi:hypothetical protein